MLDRISLTRDLVDCRGEILAPAGSSLSVASVVATASQAAETERRPLAETFAAGELAEPLTAGVYRHLFRGAQVQGAVARVLLSTELPDALWEELEAMRDADPLRFRHAVATAAVGVRMLLSAVGESVALPEIAAAGLLHDLGMRHVSLRLARGTDKLAPAEVELLAAHPLIGAHHVAAKLGRHPAVEAALAHHWRRGQGYPLLAAAPSRLVEVLGVASAFVALTQPRAFRSGAYDARGAADVLIAEGAQGRGDLESVKLLVHALRGGKGDLRGLQFGRERVGHSPVVNNKHYPFLRSVA